MLSQQNKVNLYKELLTIRVHKYVNLYAMLKHI